VLSLHDVDCFYFGLRHCLLNLSCQLHWAPICLEGVRELLLWHGWVRRCVNCDDGGVS
jgi:hypothetical protein